MRRSAVPNAAAAAQADPPPGVGDADANASRTSLNGRSAKEATNHLPHRIGSDTVNGHALLPPMFAAENADRAAGKAEERGEIADEFVVRRALDRRRGQTHEDGGITLAVGGGFGRAG